MLSIFSCTYWPPLCLFRSNAHLKNNFIYSVILAVLSLRCCASFSLVRQVGAALSVRPLLTVVASLVVERRLEGTWWSAVEHVGSVAAVPGL